MDKKEAIKKLNQLSKAEGNIGRVNKPMAEAARMGAEALAKQENGGWIPVTERLPENGSYIMVSFDNFSVPDIGRYEEDAEGGAFYPGDDDKSYVQYDLFVNAWMPLPELYREESEAD